MTNSEVIIDIKAKLSKMEGIGLLTVIASDMWAETRERIFTDGELTSGASLPAYSSKPFYVGAEGVSKLQPPIGKTGKSVFKNGKKHKSRYFALGYVGLKAKLGRPNPFDLTGQLKKSYSYTVSKDSAVLGFIGVPRLTLSKKASDTKLDNGKLAEYLEDKYGPIFDHTQAELKKIDQIIERELDTLLR